METQQPTADQIEELRKLIEAANNVGDQAVAYSGQRLRTCLEIGQRLNAWKKQLGHGRWEEFAEEQWPELSKPTRTRWQQLATARDNGRLDLENARGIRHAYVLAGIIPDTAESSNTKGSSKTCSYLVHIARLVAALQAVDVSRLSAKDRATLAERLQPVLKLHERLTTTDDSQAG